MPEQKGFTLIELMITIAVIAILAAIALPSYLNYSAKSAERACLSEVKAYSNMLALARSEGQADSSIAAPANSACSSLNIDGQVISGTPRQPGSATQQIVISQVQNL